MLDSQTRWVLDRGRPGLLATNGRTRSPKALAPAAPVSFKAAFVDNYPHIRQVCTAAGDPGLVVVAVDSAGLAMSAYIGAKPDGINTATLGRHGQCDLYFHDPDLSLRHLAVAVYPRANGGLTRFRLVDLRTQTGFVDEHCCVRNALEADGPMFVRVGGQVVFCFPVGEGLEHVRWPEDREAAWQGLPARVYAGEVRAFGAPAVSPPYQDASSLRRRSGWGTGPAHTLLYALPAPQRPHRRIGAQEEALVGWLELVEHGSSHQIEIGKTAAQGGLLLGRYDRCDTNGLHVLHADRVSRVHALILHIDGATYLIDTAMTCPGFGPRWTAQLMSTVINPHRFRTKRQLWAYSGLGIVTRSSSDWVQQQGRWVKANVAQCMGLNRMHNRTLKNVFKGAAMLVSVRLKPDRPLRKYYQSLLDKGTKPNLAQLTLARKLAAIVLAMWKHNQEFNDAMI